MEQSLHMGRSGLENWLLFNPICFRLDQAKPLQSLEGHRNILNEESSHEHYHTYSHNTQRCQNSLIEQSLICIYYHQRNNLVFTTHVSYLEIYNDSGYDLLDPRHEASKLEDLPYVIFSLKHYFNPYLV